MEQLVLNWLQKTFDQEFCSKIEFAAVPRGQSGDIAMKFFLLAKSESKSPIEIANKIAEALKDCNLIDKTEMAGPYLNLFFASEEFFKQVLNAPLKGTAREGKKVLIEFSSPNTNKPFHLGHMRNHALGLSVSNCIEAAGAEVIRTTIFNDRGVHICKSMLAYDRFGENTEPNKKSDHFVGDWYVRFAEEVKKNPDMDNEVQQMLLDWENGDKHVNDLWQKMNDWAFAGYHATYARQGLKFDKEYFESDLYKVGKELVLEGLEKGILQKKDDGAVFIDMEEIGLDEKILLRSNGTTVYMTQDINTTITKQRDFEPDEQIWVVADEQNYHFKVLFFILEKLGLIKSENLHHLGYGLVNLPDGRMKSREGTVVDADNLMDELHELASEEIKNRHDDWSEEETNEAAEKIQNAAWKFFLLQTSPKKSITFDAKKSIAFEGATGPYLQYATVRINSILRKAEGLPTGDFSNLLGEEEKILGAKILAFEGVINRAAENLNSTYVVTYLLELAQDWSSYYGSNSVLKAETPELCSARVMLAGKVLSVLNRGMEILGFNAPERM